MYPEVNRREFGILLYGFAAGHLLRPREARAQQEPPIDAEELDVLGVAAEGGQPPEIVPAALPPDRALLQRYFAQGPYMDTAPWQNRVFQHTSSGATVVLSEQTSNEIQLPPLPPLTQQDGILITPDETYLLRFNEDTKRDKVTLLTAEGEVAVEYPTSNPFYKPQTLWHDTLGMVGADTFRVTHAFDPQTAAWSELETYVPLGTPEQRIKESLQDFLTATYEVDGQILPNIFDLNPAEVAQYLKTGKDDGLTTFTILRNAKGEPAIILVTGGTYGLRKDLGNIENVQKGWERLLQINPDIAEQFNRLGLRAIAQDPPPQAFIGSRSDYAFSFDAKLGIIKANEKKHGRSSYISIMFALLAETQGINNVKHLEWDGVQWVYLKVNRSNDTDVVDKHLAVRYWINQYRDQLTSEEYQRISTAVQFNLKLFGLS